MRAAAPPARHPAGVQDRRHLRGRVRRRRTPYHYSSYDEETEVAPQPDRQKVIILGSGPNRIGQGIEFDYSCVHAVMALRDAGYETVMINCNPETVSTDYDTADRLYFEPLTFEDVLEVVHAEQAVRRPWPASSARSAARRRSGSPSGSRTPACRCSAPSPRRSTSPSTAARSAGCSPRPACPRRKHGTATSFDRGQGGRRRDRLPGARPPVLRPRRPRHGDRLRRGAPRRLHQPGHRDHAPTTRCSSTASSTTRSRSTSTRSTTAPTCTSAASWSTSRRPASTPATRRARCRRSRSARGDIADVRASTLAHRRRASACAGCSTCSTRWPATSLYVLEANPRASRTVPFVSKATAVPAGQGGRPDRARRDDRRAARRRDCCRPRATAATCPTTRRSRSRRPCCRSHRFRTPAGDQVDSILGPEMKSTGEVMGFDGHLRHRVREVAGRGLRLAADQGHGVRQHRQPRQAGGDLPGEAAVRPRASASSPPPAPRRCCAATASTPRSSASSATAPATSSRRSSPARSTSC